MMRNAVIVATFVYNTANRDEKLPRKPLPRLARTRRRLGSAAVRPDRARGSLHQR